MKNFKLITSVGSAALVLAGAATAAPPDPRQWSVTNGNITSSLVCDGTVYQCSGELTGDGFFQRQVRDVATGEIYFQTIITTAGATAAETALSDLAFYDESFVQASFNNANNEGIIDVQHIREAGATVFEADTAIATGSLATAGTNNLALAQRLYNTAGDFRTDFFMAANDLANTGADGNPANFWMKVTAQVDMNAANTDSQNFLLARARGNYQDGVAITDLGGVVGESVSAAAGEDFQGTWITQDLNQTVGQQFAFVAYDNFDDANPALAEFGLDVDAQNFDEVAEIQWPVTVLGSELSDGTGFSTTGPDPDHPLP